MWPFRRAVAVSDEERARLRRRCGLGVGTLRNCLAANAGKPATCSSLETQILHCYAEVLDPALAAKHEACFKRVVNSGGRIPASTCEANVEAMRKALASRKLYPLVR